MIFNGVECFAYLITISNFRWRFAGLRSTPRMRNTARSVEMYNWMLCVCVCCVECKLNCKRCSNILRCVEFSTPNKIIFIQRVCNEDVVVAATPLRNHLPKYEIRWESSVPDEFYAKIKCKLFVREGERVRETERSQQLQTPNPSGKIPSSNIVSMMNSKQLKRKTRFWLLAPNHLLDFCLFCQQND